MMNNRKGRGQGQGQGSSGKGRGAGMGSAPGAGPGGFCVCPQCGEKIPHQQGVPCYSVVCPKCQIKMTRS